MCARGPRDSRLTSSERLSASSRSWVTSRTLIPRARPMRRRPSPLERARWHRGRRRLIHQDELGFHGEDLRKRHALALASAQVTWKAFAETRKTQALEPCIRLAERFAALHAVECETERTLSRAVFHGSSASSWNRMPICERARSVSIVPDNGFCNPITARNRLDLPEPKARRGSRNDHRRRRDSLARGWAQHRTKS